MPRSASLVTVERVVEGNLLEDERLAAGTINATYVTEIAIAERGAHPVALLDEYGTDAAHVARLCADGEDRGRLRRLAANARSLGARAAAAE